MQVGGTTVKPVYSDYPRETKNVAFIDRWLLYAGSYTDKAKKKKFYVALIRPTVKCEKNRVCFFYFIFFMSDLGEEFAKICIQWLKKALVYAF